MPESYKKEYTIQFPTEKVVTIRYPAHSILKKDDWNKKIFELVDHLESNYANMIESIVRELMKTGYSKLTEEEKIIEKKKIKKAELSSIFLNVSNFGKSIILYLNYDKFLNISVYMDYDDFNIEDVCFEE